MPIYLYRKRRRKKNRKNVQPKKRPGEKTSGENILIYP